MTAFAVQVLAVGGQQVVSALPLALVIAFAAILAVGFALAAWWLLTARHALRADWRQRYERPAPEEVGDDTIAMIRAARKQDRAEAEADAMAVKWRDKQGGGRG